MPGGGSSPDPVGAGTGSDRRAASDVIGVVLLFAMVLAGAVVVAVSGGSAVESVQQGAGYAAAEDAMVDLKSDMASVVQDSTGERVRFEMGGGETDRMRVSADGVIGFTVHGVGATCTATREIGSVEYQSGDGDVLAYQANAVWRTGDGAGVETVSPPDLTYRTTTTDDGYRMRTLTFPLTNVDVSRSEAQSPSFTARPSREGGLDLFRCSGTRIRWVDNVTVRVSNNSFYEGWADYLAGEFSEYRDDLTPAQWNDVFHVYDGNRTVVVENVPLGRLNDADDDGVADAEDDCPGVAGGGVDGCALLDTDGGRLVVNQTAARFSVLGTIAARNNTTTETTTVRNATKVMLALDGTGSMAEHDTNWKRVRDWPTILPGRQTVPGSGPQGEVLKWYKWTGRSWVGYDPGDTITLTPGDALYKRVAGNDPSEKRVDASKNLVGLLNSSRGDRVGWTQFRTGIGGCTERTPEECSHVKASGLRANFVPVNRTLENLVRDQGGTYMGAGLYKAIGEFPATPVDDDVERVVVLLSDGKNDPPGGWSANKSDLDDWTIDQAERAADRNVTVYTVGLGSNVDTGLMERIAAETGGEYYAVSDASGLGSAFEDALRDTRTSTTHRIEYSDVETTVRVNGSRHEAVAARNTQTPGGSPGGRTVRFPPGSRVSLGSVVYGCNPGSRFGTVDGTPQVACRADGVDASVSQGATPSLHAIYADGDAVPSSLDANPEPYRANLSALAGEYVTVDAAGDRVFDLAPHERIFVLELPASGNYVVVHFETDPADDWGVDAGGEGHNRYVVDVGGEEVVVDGD